MSPDSRSNMVTREHLRYVQHGIGPEHVLVMHDWNTDHSSYEPVLPYLDRDKFTYVFVDLRGYGESRGLSGDYTVDEISRDCLDVADKLGWSRFHVIGHSMTGMVTQRMVVDAKGRIKSAVAVCPLSAAGSPASDEVRTFFASTTHNDDAFCRLIKFLSGDLSDQWVLAKLRQNRRTVDPACRAGYLRMFTETEFVEEVRGDQTPFLVVVAEKDPGLDESAMRRTFLAWHPNAVLSVIPNCGHYPMQECPPYFVTIVERFLGDYAG